MVAEAAPEHLRHALVDSHHLREVVLVATAIEVEDLVQQPLEDHDEDGGGHIAP